MEMLACGTPIVATDVGVMPQLLASQPQALYAEDDAAGLAQAVAAQLQHPTPLGAPIDGWAQIIGGMEQRLRKMVVRLR